jgi:hypothetical protein
MLVMFRLDGHPRGAVTPRGRWSALALLPAAVVLGAASAGAVPRGAGLVTGSMLAAAGALRLALERLVERRLERQADALLNSTNDLAVPPRLAWRAAELVAPRERLLLARSLRGGLAQLARPGVTAAIPFDRQALAGSTTLVLELADVLADLATPVRPGGIVLTRRLLGDGLSPLYLADSPAQLRLALERALTELRPAAAAPRRLAA